MPSDIPNSVKRRIAFEAGQFMACDLCGKMSVLVGTMIDGCIFRACHKCAGVPEVESKEWPVKTEEPKDAK